MRSFTFRNNISSSAIAIIKINKLDFIGITIYKRSAAYTLWFYPPDSCYDTMHLKELIALQVLAPANIGIRTAWHMINNFVTNELAAILPEIIINRHHKITRLTGPFAYIVISA